jgi:hypothetical protein
MNSLRTARYVQMKGDSAVSPTYSESGGEVSGAHRSVVITLFVCAIGIAATFSAIRETGLDKLPTPVVLTAAAGLLFVSWWRWKVGLQTILVLIIVEGAIRKWFLVSYADLVYFYKDALMLAVIMGYSMRARATPFLLKRDIQIVAISAAAFAIYAIAISANPRAPHFFTSLFGIKAYCLYMPLMILVPRMFSTKADLIAFLRWYVVIALMVAFVGVWQFRDNSADSTLNQYVQTENTAGVPQDTALFADSSGNHFVRITSTFSFVSGLTVYLPVAFGLLLGLTSLRATRTLSLGIRIIYYLAIAAVVMTAFMTGSRGVIINLAIVALVFFAFTSSRNAIKRLRQITIGGVMVFLALSIVSPQAVDALYERALGGESQIDEGRERIETVFTLPLEEASLAGPFGYGIGATQNSVPALMNRLNLTHTGDPIPIAVESEPGRVMLELGVVGFVLFSLMRIGILIVTLRSCLLIRDPEMKALAVAAFANLVFFVVVGGAVVNHTQNVYQWFLVGMVFAVSNADRLAWSSERVVTDRLKVSRFTTTLSTPSPALDR